MLKSLLIQNVALIERAELEFSEGLNVLTGETGAGKSVLLSSIEFVLGGKADRSMIRFGEPQCSVRAEFSNCSPEIHEKLSEMDIEAEETLILSRKLTADGKSSAKINGCAVTVSMLKDLASRLVDIHGQSEHFYLLNPSNQLKLLDRIGGKLVFQRKNAVKKLLDERKTLLSQLQSLGGDESERERRLDILKFQLDEIYSASLKEGEEEALLSLRDKLSHAEKILSGLNTVRESLEADGGVTDGLQMAQRALSQILKYSPELSEYADRLENAKEEIDDIAESLHEAAEALDLDENALERTENRLEEYKLLKKKYGGSLTSVQEFYARAEEEYALLKDGAEKRKELLSRLERCEDALFSACRALNEERKKAAKSFTQKVVEELKALNISSPAFEVRFTEYPKEQIGRVTGEGLGEITFLFSANAGEPLKELGKIISGGEMSRFMLAVKTQIAALEGIECALFDEIDAGIGGKTGKVVAEKLMKISKVIQVISVSHLSQIAAGADRQFLIEKSEREGRTYTLVRLLSDEQRRFELARMISGDKNELSLQHADEMIKSACVYKKSLCAK